MRIGYLMVIEPSDEYFVLSYQTYATFPFWCYLLTLCCFSNFCRFIKLLSYYQTLAIVGFQTFFLGVYISLVISQDIPSCETFSRDCTLLYYIPSAWYPRGNQPCHIHLFYTPVLSGSAVARSDWKPAAIHPLFKWNYYEGVMKYNLANIASKCSGVSSKGFSLFLLHYQFS